MIKFFSSTVRIKIQLGNNQYHLHGINSTQHIWFRPLTKEETRTREKENINISLLCPDEKARCGTMKVEEVPGLISVESDELRIIDKQKKSRSTHCRAKVSDLKMGKKSRTSNRKSERRGSMASSNNNQGSNRAKASEKLQSKKKTYNGDTMDTRLCNIYVPSNCVSDISSSSHDRKHEMKKSSKKSSSLSEKKRSSSVRKTETITAIEAEMKETLKKQQLLMEQLQQLKIRYSSSEPERRSTTNTEKGRRRFSCDGRNDRSLSPSGRPKQQRRLSTKNDASLEPPQRKAISDKLKNRSRSLSPSASKQRRRWSEKNFSCEAQRIKKNSVEKSRRKSISPFPTRQQRRDSVNNDNNPIDIRQRSSMCEKPKARSRSLSPSAAKQTRKSSINNNIHSEHRHTKLPMSSSGQSTLRKNHATKKTVAESPKRKKSIEKMKEAPKQHHISSMMSVTETVSAETVKCKNSGLVSSTMSVTETVSAETVKIKNSGQRQQVGRVYSKSPRG